MMRFVTLIRYCPSGQRLRNHVSLTFFKGTTIAKGRERVAISKPLKLRGCDEGRLEIFIRNRNRCGISPAVRVEIHNDEKTDREWRCAS